MMAHSISGSVAGALCGLGMVLLSGCMSSEPPPLTAAAASAPAAEDTAKDAPQEDPAMTSSEPDKGRQFPVEKTEAEWRALLTPEQFYITREKGTERAGTGKYWLTETPGLYQCVCCDQPLFLSDGKFKSGCGWPSFFEAVDDQAIVTQPDLSIPPPRVEIMCGRCGAHLGHVFEDGPPPTGLRYCVNSASVKLIAEGDDDSASE